MHRPVAATTVAMLLGCAAVASVVAPVAAADGTGPAPIAAAATANTPPVAVDDTAEVTVGGSVVVAVLANDHDPEDGPIELLGVVDPPAHGSASLVSGGVEYTPGPSYVGPDSFTYEISDGELTAVGTVTITVSATPNTAPVAVDDQARTRWGSPVTVAVLANDTDPDGDPLTLARVWRPSSGRAEIVGDTIRFTPSSTVVGEVAVPYRVSDGRGATADAVLSVRVEPAFRVELRRVSTPVALRTATVRGAVSTRLDGPVTVTLQRRSDAGRWLALRSSRIRGEDTFTLRWRPREPGPMVLRLKAVWEDGPTRSTAGERVRVEARFDPVVRRVTRRDVPHTWRPGCPVGPEGLRKIRMSYWDYRGRLQRGTLIGASWVVGDYLAIFRRAFDTKFAIKKMYPVDRYGGDDKRAMRAGNTSAFNCRHVTGNPYRMSQHSWGNAIDINTFENPYVTGSRVYPPKAAVPYYYRRKHNLQDPGVITARSSIARELWRQGWAWGARWSHPDYQHWSSNGG